MSALMDAAPAHRGALPETHGVKLGFMSFFARAVVDALTRRAAGQRADRGDDIVYHHYVHLGIAVGAERGLVVPVVRNAERMRFAEVERADRRARGPGARGKLAPDELAGGTFTISNGGVLRLAALDADPQPAAERHPRPARDPGAAGRASTARSWSAPDDVRRALLRSPHRRRPRGGDRSSSASRSCVEEPGAAAARGLMMPEPTRARPGRHRRGPGGYVAAIRAAQLGLRRRLRREGARARRHVPAHRLHPAQGAARVERALRQTRAALARARRQGRGRRRSTCPRMLARKDKVVRGLTTGVVAPLQEERGDAATAARRASPRPDASTVAGGRRATEMLAAPSTS